MQLEQDYSNLKQSKNYGMLSYDMLNSEENGIA